MGVSGRVVTGVVFEAGTTIGMLSREACGRRTNGAGRVIAVAVGVVTGRVGIGGSS